MAYVSPQTLAEALEMVATSGVTCIAGGTDLYPAKQQGQSFDAVLDVTRIDGFRDITTNGAGTRFGAATTWSDVAHADLPPAFDALKEAARDVGSVQIQNAATIAGNICNASPAADGIPPLLALDASVEMSSARAGVRQVPLQDFVTGVRQTALADDELVTAILVPPPPANSRSAFEKLGSRTHLVISIVMSAVNVALDDDGRMSDVRIAVGACSATALRLLDLEKSLNGARPHDVTITPHNLSALSPIDDVRGSASYRTDAAAAQIKRAIQRAAEV